MKTEKEFLLKEITKEIESKLDCVVISIDYIVLLSPCVMVKVTFREDFHYQPEWLKYSISSICFSQLTIQFTRSIDLFDCINKNVRLN